MRADQLTQRLNAVLWKFRGGDKGARAHFARKLQDLAVVVRRLPAAQGRQLIAALRKRVIIT